MLTRQIQRPPPRKSALPNSDFPSTDWLKSVDGSKKIFSLSIPGTHETCARYGGGHYIWRAAYLDIRCRHISDCFMIHRGVIFKHLSFGSASTFWELIPLNSFLCKYMKPIQPPIIHARSQKQCSHISKNTKSFSIWKKIHLHLTLFVAKLSFFGVMIQQVHHKETSLISWITQSSHQTQQSWLVSKIATTFLLSSIEAQSGITFCIFWMSQFKIKMKINWK